MRGSSRDHAFASALLGEGLLDAKVLAARIEDLPIEEQMKDRIRAWLRGQQHGEIRDRSRESRGKIT